MIRFGEMHTYKQDEEVKEQACWLGPASALFLIIVKDRKDAWGGKNQHEGAGSAPPSCQREASMIRVFLFLFLHRWPAE